MEEKKDLQELTFEDDFVRKITEAENRYYQEITITNVQGECPYGHVAGDVFRVTNCKILAQYGVRVVCAEPVTGSSGIPQLGAKKRETKSCSLPGN